MPPDPLERIERKLDAMDQKQDRRAEKQEQKMTAILERLSASEARCVATHAGVDRALKEDRSRIREIEGRVEKASLQRAGWIGGWKVMVLMAGALAALGGLTVAILRLFG